MADPIVLDTDDKVFEFAARLNRDGWVAHKMSFGSGPADLSSGEARVHFEATRGGEQVGVGTGDVVVALKEDEDGVVVKWWQGSQDAYAELEAMFGNA